MPANIAPPPFSVDHNWETLPLLDSAAAPNARNACDSGPALPVIISMAVPRACIFSLPFPAACPALTIPPAAPPAARLSPSAARAPSWAAVDHRAVKNPALSRSPRALGSSPVVRSRGISMAVARPPKTLVMLRVAACERASAAAARSAPASTVRSAWAAGSTPEAFAPTARAAAAVCSTAAVALPAASSTFRSAWAGCSMACAAPAAPVATILISTGSPMEFRRVL